MLSEAKPLFSFGGNEIFLKQGINSHVSLPLNIFYTHRYYDKQVCFTCQKFLLLELK